jgi:hypothetical protein
MAQEEVAPGLTRGAIVRLKSLASPPMVVTQLAHFDSRPMAYLAWVDKSDNFRSCVLACDLLEVVPT